MRMATGRVALADLPHDGAGRSCLFTRGLARTIHRGWLGANSSSRRGPVDPRLIAVHIAHVGHTRPDLLLIRHEEERRQWAPNLHNYGRGSLRRKSTQ